MGVYWKTETFNNEGHKMKNKRVLVLVPAYNEQDNIKNIVDNLIPFKSQGIDYIVVDDGSKDDTAGICRENGYNYISHPINLGLTGAFRTGIKYAYAKKYDYMMQIDADGQHDPKYINDIVAAHEQEGADIVIGSRFVTEKRPGTLRMIGSRLITACIRITTGKKIMDPTSGMRSYNKRAINAIYKQGFLRPEPDTLAYLMRSGFSVKEVQVNMRERLTGTSYLTFTKSIRYMADICSSIIIVQWFRKVSI